MAAARRPRLGQSRRCRSHAVSAAAGPPHRPRTIPWRIGCPRATMEGRRPYGCKLPFARRVTT
eukprot:13484777-Alexandrium_andersonii.AAC.1